jgi:D-alanyl-D-alanine-carboxypeptidase/D-alanyl-D-alanine-endopeptidase
MKDMIEIPPGLRGAARRAAVAFFLTSALAVAQQPLSLADADERGAAMFKQSGATGMVLVVVRNREVMIRGYGETAPKSGAKPGANALVRLCSISKVFAGELLVELANEGKVKLNDPLQRYAPRNVVVPEGANKTPVTLLDLATHTAGLPREVGPYPEDTAHFTFPDWNYRWEWLPKQKLIYRPGTAALYSNIGFDLLGDALASATNKSYARLLDERIIWPLGMRDTTLSPTAEQCGRLMRGATDEGACTDTQASGPSGGLYSTPVDMARMMRYLLRVPGTSAQTAPPVAIYLKPDELKSVRKLNHAGAPTGIGAAWIQLGDPDGPSTLVQKTGGGAGFETYIVLSLKRQTGVFFAVTKGKRRSRTGLVREANNLLTDLAGVPPVEPKAKKARAEKKKPARAHRRGSKKTAK